MRFLVSFFIFLFLCFPVIAINTDDYEKYYAQMPVYPKAKIYDLKKYVDVKMKMHLTEADFEKVTSYYIKHFEEKGWKVEFPNPLELKIWMEALHSDRSKTPNIMLSLTKNNPKLNCNITIGVVKDARSSKNLTIITLYLTDKFN